MSIFDENKLDVKLSESSILLEQVHPDLYLEPKRLSKPFSTILVSFLFYMLAIKAIQYLRKIDF